MCDLNIGDKVVIHQNGLQNQDAAYKSGIVKKIMIEVEYEHLKKSGWFKDEKGIITVAEQFVHKVGKCDARFDLNGTQVACDLIDGHVLSPTAPNKHHGVHEKVEVTWV